MTTNQKQLKAGDFSKLPKKTSQTKLAQTSVSNWNNAPTTNYNTITELLSSVQNAQISIAISHDAGAGKSHAYRLYAANNTNVIYVECKSFWTKKTYVKNLLLACGIDNFGTVDEIIETFTNHIKTLHKPVIIIDQIDKLKDPSLDLFVDLENDLYKKAGFLISGVPALKKRVEKGVQKDKSGYRELWSRIGRKFIALDPIKLKDVKAVCEANGIVDNELIDEFFRYSAGDMRRVERDIIKQKLIESKKSA